MKTLNKKMLGILLVVCLMCTLCTQTALADDGMDNVFPEDGIVISQYDMMELTADSIDNTDAYATYSGTRVLQIYVYPLGIDLDTGDHIVAGNIYKKITYVSSGQGESVFLDKSQTKNLMDQMQEYLDGLPRNCELYGWRVKGTISFDYYKIRYVTCRYATSTSTTEYKNLNISSSGNYTFQHDFAYPTNVNISSQYYYVRIEGAVYYTNNNGTQSDALYFLGAGFN